MSFLFISHASSDKIQRIRPLVEVLIAEGESVWVDRPGAGVGNLGLSQQYIDRHGIDFLQSGRPWSASIGNALQEAGAVLGCLSKALVAERAVLLDELTFADLSGKLVTCIVDDLPFSALSQVERGLLSLSKHQAPQIDCQVLRQALDLVNGDKAGVTTLSPILQAEWEKVRNLLDSVNRVRHNPRRASISTPLFPSSKGYPSDQS